SVATFGVEAAASQVIHNAELVAEAYGADGAMQNRKPLLARGRIFYRWQAHEEHALEFGQMAEKGGVRLLLTCDEGRYERWFRFGGWEGTAKVGAIYGQDRDTADARDFRTTPFLRGQAYLPSVARVPGVEQPVRIFEAKQGTVEFWIKPEWPGVWPLPRQASEYCRFSHAFLHFGIQRPDYPRHTNQASLVILHDDAYGSLRFGIRSKDYVPWTAEAQTREDGTWQPGQWRHVAAVWDADAERKDWLRLYVDGKRVSGVVTMEKEERLGEDKSVRVELDSSFFIQIGSLNSGRQPARAAIDELRISRTARYRQDFAPSFAELRLDKDTAALFHFNGSLQGEGLTADGARMAFSATPGTVQHN
ncbi:MAG: LamG domain-containing protein, partial [Planctomycetes bacterium]|nr:LamG domain-containing protein [Planctomycetota bacterium]